MFCSRVRIACAVLCPRTNSPGLNIDPDNHASIVHLDTAFGDGKHVLETVELWNTVSGSGQIITNGVITIPTYKDANNPDGLLTPGGPANYSDANSWYNLTNARTVIGLSQDNRFLYLFTVDNAGGSRGMNLLKSRICFSPITAFTMRLTSTVAAPLAWQWKIRLRAPGSSSTSRQTTQMADPLPAIWRYSPLRHPSRLHGCFA